MCNKFNTIVFLVVCFIATTAVGALFTKHCDVPGSMRTKNWLSRTDQGSCVNASTITCLNWAGQEELADWWPKAHEGGESLNSTIQHLEDTGLPYAYTVNDREGGLEFLKWAARNRLVCGIFFGTWHCQNYVGYENGYYMLLDNNHPERLDYYSEEEFLQWWGGNNQYFAFCFVLPPPPAYPK